MFSAELVTHTNPVSKASRYMCCLRNQRRAPSTDPASKRETSVRPQNLSSPLDSFVRAKKHSTKVRDEPRHTHIFSSGTSSSNPIYSRKKITHRGGDGIRDERCSRGERERKNRSVHDREKKNADPLMQRPLLNRARGAQRVCRRLPFLNPIFKK